MNRNALLSHVDLWKSKLGSYAKVAAKCNINPAALSTIMAGKYGADEARMLQKIAKALDYKESSWKVVTTISGYKQVERIFKDAKNESMWFTISNPAGSGKSGPLEDLYNKDTTGSVVYFKCEEWSARQFMTNIVLKTLGEGALEGRYKSIAQLTDIVANYFNDMSLERPIMLIDEVDKLKPAAKCLLIPIFNRTEERLGVILSGTENFEKEMRSGVRLHKKGYDELESRFGRTYIHLSGANEKDVREICAANGATSAEIQQDIWERLPKVQKPAKVKTATGHRDVMVSLVEDLRLVKRFVQRTLLINRSAA